MSVRGRRFAVEGSPVHGHGATTAGFRIQHIGGGRLTVVSSDELGVERVEVYEVAPRELVPPVESIVPYGSR